MSSTAQFNPDLDAQLLHKSLSGLGTSEKNIIDVLCDRTSAQLQQIAQVYRSKFGKELLADLKSDTSGQFYRVIKALLNTPEVNDCHAINKAIKGAGTDEESLLEILGTRTNKEIHAITQAYFSEYKKSLTEDIIGDVSGGIKQLLVALIAGNRDETSKVDPVLVKRDAAALAKAGPKKWGTDISVFTDIFTQRNFVHLRSVLEEFEKLQKNSMEKVIEAEMSGDTKIAFLTMLMIVRNKEAYFADRIQSAANGMGTKDGKLIRVLVSRREKDLPRIANEFEINYKRSLNKLIEEETSGDYKDALLTILCKSQHLCT